MKSLSLATAALAALVASTSVSAEIIRVNVGPTLNPFFLRLSCNQMAQQRGGRVVKSERVGANKNGVCYIDVPRPKPVVRPAVVRPVVQPQPVPAAIVPRQPNARMKMVGVGRLWSQDHANQRCNALAIRKDAKWTGLWKKHDVNGEARCQLSIIPKPKFVVTAINAGRIWNDAHAKQQCARIAKKNGGTWNGTWKSDVNNPNRAVCMVRMKPAPKGVVKRFRTGKLWNDSHAKQHCNRLAKQNKGQWLGEWRATRDGKGSVCMIKVASKPNPAIQKAPPKPVKPVAPKAIKQPAPVASQPKNIRDVNAGPIWDQAQAQRKCPLIARNAKGRWTGRWTKINTANNNSVCEVEFGAVTGAIAQVPAAAPQPTPAPPKPAPVSTRTRYVAAGPIWDAAQAKRKCPVIAVNNKASWTGEWKKVGPGNTSVCQIAVVVKPKAAPAQPVQSYQPSTIKEVPAGGIWDQAQANRKCPVIAANNKARWTGRWRKVGANNASVCEIDTRI